MMLHDSPDLTTLLASLPADPDRERIEGTFLKRERQYHALQNRAAVIRERCAAIAAALPDAPAKQAQGLRDERRDLLAEQSALPDDLTVGARLYADALAAWSVATLAAIGQERGRVNTALAATETAHQAAKYDLDQFPPGSTPAGYDAAHTAYRASAGKRQPHIDRADELTRLETLATAFVQRALATGGDNHGVKLAQGRPVAAHVARFVTAATKAA